MRLVVNFFAGFFIVCIVVLAVWVFFYLKKSMDDTTSETIHKKKKGGNDSIVPDFAQETVLIHMPKVYYRIPGQDWKCLELTKKVTSIGRDKENDICINHPTVSRKQAEIQMKMRRIGAEKKGVRYFKLKNCAYENPIQYVIPDGSGETRDIVKPFTLIEKESVFYFGQVEIMITLPDRVRVKSGPGDFPVKEIENRDQDIQSDEKEIFSDSCSDQNREKSDENKSGDTNKKRKSLKSQIRF